MDKMPSKNQKQALNLITLKQEYRDKGPAEKGYKKLTLLIKKGANEDLAWLLRDHETEGGVYLKRELDFRYEVDYLIKFYSLLQLAVMTGYISSKLPKEMREEIISILDDRWVKNYYEKNYPLYLPRVLLKAAKENISQKIFGPSSLLMQLIMLDYKEDKDVEVFLFLLDGFNYDGKDIDDLNSLLSSKSEVKKILQKKRKGETRLDQAFWGFIKHNDFMQDYKVLLEKCKNPTLRSAFWHFRGYWFKNMKDLMRDKYLEGVNNIKEMTDKISAGEYKSNFKKDEKKVRLAEDVFDADKNFLQWKKQSDQQVKETYKTVRYNLNAAHSKALLSYMRTL